MSDWDSVDRPVPVPDDLTRHYWQAASNGRLELQCCQHCGKFQHPPQANCSSCMSTDLEFEEVGGKGTIYSYTIMYHSADERFAAAIPYANVVVQLDDAPEVYLVTNLVNAEYTDAKVGKRVELVFEPLGDGVALPQFQLLHG